MSDRQSFFLVIEGLDGSGKSEISRRLAELMRTTLDDRVMLTYEPHDPSAAGLYIRRVLRQKIVVSSRTLALAFALNRADHNERVVGPYLDQDGRRVVLCDRYIMSSLVYNASLDLPMQDVWELNSGARRPDLTLFLDATAEICYARMGARGGNRDLFETNLAESRTRYFEAIEFLRQRGERVQVIDANPDLLVVLNSIIDALRAHGPRWLTLQKLMFLEATAPAILAPPPLELERWMRDFVDRYTAAALGDLAADDGIRRLVAAEVNRLPLDELAALMMNFLHTDRRYRFESAWPGQPIDYTVIRPNGETGGLVILQDERRWEGVMRALESEFIAPHYSIRRDSIQFVVALDPSHAGEEVAQFVPDTGAVPVEVYGRGTLIQYFTRHITRRVLADPLAAGLNPPQLSMELPDNAVLAEDWSLAAALALHAADTQTPEPPAEVSHEQEGIDRAAEAYSYVFAPPLETPDAAGYAEPDENAASAPARAAESVAEPPAATEEDELSAGLAAPELAQPEAAPDEEGTWDGMAAPEMTEPAAQMEGERAWQEAGAPEGEVSAEEVPAWHTAYPAEVSEPEASEDDAGNWMFEDAAAVIGPEAEVGSPEIPSWQAMDEPELEPEAESETASGEALAWQAVDELSEPEIDEEALRYEAAWNAVYVPEPETAAPEEAVEVEPGGEEAAPWHAAYAPPEPEAAVEMEPEAEAGETEDWAGVAAPEAEAEPEPAAEPEAEADESAWEVVYALAEPEAEIEAEPPIEEEIAWTIVSEPEAEPETSAAAPEAPVAEDWVTSAARGYVFAPFPWGEAEIAASVPPPEPAREEPEPEPAPEPVAVQPDAFSFDIPPMPSPEAPVEPAGRAPADPYADSLRDELPWRARWSALRGKRDTAEQRPVRLPPEPELPPAPSVPDFSFDAPANGDPAAASASEMDAIPAHDSPEPTAEE